MNVQAHVRKGEHAPPRLDAPTQSTACRGDEPQRVTAKNAAAWETMFNGLKEFASKHGHMRVPLRERYDDRSLGAWMHSQRRTHRSNNLLPERRKKLESIGFDFEPSGGKKSPRRAASSAPAVSRDKDGKSAVSRNQESASATKVIPAGERAVAASESESAVQRNGSNSLSNGEGGGPLSNVAQVNVAQGRSVDTVNGEPSLIDESSISDTEEEDYLTKLNDRILAAEERESALRLEREIAAAEQLEMIESARRASSGSVSSLLFSSQREGVGLRRTNSQVAQGSSQRGQGTQPTVSTETQQPESDDDYVRATKCLPRFAGPSSASGPFMTSEQLNSSIVAPFEARSKKDKVSLSGFAARLSPVKGDQNSMCLEVLGQRVTVVAFLGSLRNWCVTRVRSINYALLAANGTRIDIKIDQSQGFGANIHSFEQFGLGLLMTVNPSGQLRRLLGPAADFGAAVVSHSGHPCSSISDFVDKTKVPGDVTLELLVASNADLTSIVSDRVVVVPAATDLATLPSRSAIGDSPSIRSPQPTQETLVSGPRSNVAESRTDASVGADTSPGMPCSGSNTASTPKAKPRCTPADVTSDGEYRAGSVRQDDLPHEKRMAAAALDPPGFGVAEHGSPAPALHSAAQRKKKRARSVDSVTAASSTPSSSAFQESPKKKKRARSVGASSAISDAITGVTVRSPTTLFNSVVSKKKKRATSVGGASAASNPPTSVAVLGSPTALFDPVVPKTKKRAASVGGASAASNPPTGVAVHGSPTALLDPVTPRKNKRATSVGGASTASNPPTGVPLHGSPTALLDPVVPKKKKRSSSVGGASAASNPPTGVAIHGSPTALLDPVTPRKNRRASVASNPPTGVPVHGSPTALLDPVVPKEKNRSTSVGGTSTASNPPTGVPLHGSPTALLDPVVPKKKKRSNSVGGASAASNPPTGLPVHGSPTAVLDPVVPKEKKRAASVGGTSTASNPPTGVAVHGSPTALLDSVVPKKKKRAASFGGASVASNRPTGVAVHGSPTALLDPVVPKKKKRAKSVDGPSAEKQRATSVGGASVASNPPSGVTAPKALVPSLDAVIQRKNKQIGSVDMASAPKPVPRRSFRDILRVCSGLAAQADKPPAPPPWESNDLACASPPPNDSVDESSNLQDGVGDPARSKLRPGDSERCRETRAVRRVRFSDSFEQRQYRIDALSTEFVFEEPTATESAVDASVSTAPQLTDQGGPSGEDILFDSARFGSFSELLTLLENGAANDMLSEEPLNRIREFVKNELERLLSSTSNQDEAVAIRDLSMKDKLLKIYINGGWAIRVSKSLRKEQQFNVIIEGLDGVQLTTCESQTASSPSDAFLGVEIFATSEKQEQQLPSLPLVPLSSTVLYTGDNEYRVRQNLSSGPLQTLEFCLKRVSADRKERDLIGSATVTASHLAIKFAPGGNWSRDSVDVTPITGESLKGGAVINFRARRQPLGDSTIMKRSADEKRRIGYIVDWIARFNQELSDDERAAGLRLTANVRVGSLSLLHAAVYLEDADLARKLVELGADPLARGGFVGSPLSLATNMAEGQIERRRLHPREKEKARLQFESIVQVLRDSRRGANGAGKTGDAAAAAQEAASDRTDGWVEKVFPIESCCQRTHLESALRSTTQDPSLPVCRKVEFHEVVEERMFSSDKCSNCFLVRSSGGPEPTLPASEGMDASSAGEEVLLQVIREGALPQMLQAFEEGNAAFMSSDKLLAELQPPQEHGRDHAGGSVGLSGDGSLKDKIVRIFAVAANAVQSAKCLRKWSFFEVVLDELKGAGSDGCGDQSLEIWPHVLSVNGKVAREPIKDIPVQRKAMLRINNRFELSYNASLDSQKSIEFELKKKAASGQMVVGVGTLPLSYLCGKVSHDGDTWEGCVPVLPSTNGSLSEGVLVKILSRRITDSKKETELQAKEAKLLESVKKLVKAIKSLNRTLSERSEDQPARESNGEVAIRLRLSGNIRVANLSLLHAAVWLENVDVVKELLELGADPLARGVSVGSPLALALNMVEGLTDQEDEGTDSLLFQNVWKQLRRNQRRERRERIEEIVDALRAAVLAAPVMAVPAETSVTQQGEATTEASAEANTETDNTTTGAPADDGPPSTRKSKTRMLSLFKDGKVSLLHFMSNDWLCEEKRCSYFYRHRKCRFSPCAYWHVHRPIDNLDESKLPAAPLSRVNPSLIHVKHLKDFNGDWYTAGYRDPLAKVCIYVQGGKKGIEVVGNWWYRSAEDAKERLLLILPMFLNGWTNSL